MKIVSQFLIYILIAVALAGCGDSSTSNADATPTQAESTADNAETTFSLQPATDDGEAVVFAHATMNADGMIAAVTATNALIARFDTVTREVLEPVVDPDACCGFGIEWVAFSPDGTLIYTPTRHLTQMAEFKSYNFETGEFTIYNASGDANRPTRAVLLHPDGNILLLYSQDTLENERLLLVWDRIEEALITTVPLDYSSQITHFAYSADGSQLYVAAEDTVHVVDMGDFSIIETLTLTEGSTNPVIRAIAVHPIEDVFTVSNSTYIYHFEDGTAVRGPSPGNRSALQLAYNPTGDLLALVTGDGNFIVYSGVLRVHDVPEAFTGTPLYLGWLDDGESVILVTSTGDILLWQLADL